MPVKPTPQTWTLRLKNHRTTILLHADKTTSLSVLKSDLLLALQSAYPSGKLHNHTIPTLASEIQLAKPIDFTKIADGWESIEDVVDQDMLDESGGKKKAAATTTANGKSKQSPLTAGLRDGCEVAFRFGGESEDSGANDEWDVVMPSYEDVYGLEQLAAAAEGEDGEAEEVAG